MKKEGVFIMRDKSKYTPMMQQYLTIKENYQDAFVFFRLGDFYELFFEDAQLASKELEIALTGREAGAEERVPMCGVPHHSAENYINRLIERGYKVAVCEQVEDPASAKGVVRREVVRLLTPGTVMNQTALNEKENNFILSVVSFEDAYAIAYSDLSTGENYAMRLPKEDQSLVGELISLGCKEIVIGSDVDVKIFDNLRALKQIVLSYEEERLIPIEYQILAEEVNDGYLTQAFGRLVNYLVRTQKSALGHLQPISLTKNEDYLSIDYNSRRNLELTETIRSKSRQGSLLWLLDKTKTAMGSRLLKQWIERPSINAQMINERLDVVESFMSDFMLKEELKRHLDEVYDLERLSGRIAFGNANARDLLQLNSSLNQIPHIKALLSQLPMPTIQQQLARMADCSHITEILEKAIVDNPPIGIKEGGIIKDGYHETLDEYRYIVTHGKEWILALEAAEREKTGIRSLKIKYNKVFGYYIEISKANLHLIPEDAGYERKQTLVNAERFITEELKEKENLILNAEEKSIQLEYELFSELRQLVKNEIPKIQQIAKVMAYFDVLQSFATISEENRYTRPQLNREHIIDIKDGRHPVVEKVLKDTQYVENDCVMPSDLSILLITGPNMSGKSTYMRQLALIAIMAQIGCYVPASVANVPIFDQIFTRIGAADDLVSGHSTFMVEMMETNYALEHATKDSLILLDEIGRGTATFDGMALAQSIIEYVHDKVGAKTLFSTHYHELTQLEEKCEHLENRHVRAEEHEGQLIFMHKVMEGPSDKSYGIHVAQIAKLPTSLISRAKQLLDALEQDKTAIQNSLETAVKVEVEPVQDLPVVKEPDVKLQPALEAEQGQLSLFGVVESPKKEKAKVEVKVEYVNPYEDIIKELDQIDLYQLTPMQAMNVMYELKVKMNQRK